ncbi:hypothetical protein P3T23_006834 [Paraburkholderia sp. GAS448]|jgi:hypothetical protein|uniref:hypothetical protein n=1 Tax=Paraburkholderia sp. GAS448 TaxID=3035136 RepID=UPI003D241136
MNRKTDEWEPHMSATDYAVVKVTGPILSTDAALWSSGYAPGRCAYVFCARRLASSQALLA